MNLIKITKTLIVSALAAACALSFTITSPVEKAKAYDGCSGNGSKFALLVGKYGNVPAEYNSGSACRVNTCIPAGKTANKIGPGPCGDVAKPACFVPEWTIGYEMKPWDGSAAIPPCDSHWQSASRWQ